MVRGRVYSTAQVDPNRKADKEEGVNAVKGETQMMTSLAP